MLCGLLCDAYCELRVVSCALCADCCVLCPLIYVACCLVCDV